MGLFDLFRKKPQKSSSTHTSPSDAVSDLSAPEKNLLSQVSKINTSGHSISPDLYQQLRDFETNWLERHYDFNSIEGVNAIPVSKNVPGAPSSSSPVKGPTGEVYYYLHMKAREHADELKYDIAIACQMKSNALLKCKYANSYGRRECYYLVQLYARAGLVDMAEREKKAIEAYYGRPSPDSRDYDYAQTLISIGIKQGVDERDFAWVKEHLPELCPKSKSGFCRMRSQNSKNYQVIKQRAAELGKSV